MRLNLKYKTEMVNINTYYSQNITVCLLSASTVSVPKFCLTQTQSSVFGLKSNTDPFVECEGKVAGYSLCK